MNHRTIRTGLVFLTALFAAASVSLGHPGHIGHEAGALIAGVAHPLTGLDHILAMFAVGLLAAQIGGRALWALPVSFLGAMAVGSALGVSGLPVPVVEHGIVASVLVLGALIALAVRLPLPAVAAVVGLMAVFHGHAHGAEMPSTIWGAGYGLGFLASTALLHAAGLAGGLGVTRIGALSPKVVRLAGGLIAASSMYLWMA